MSQKEIELILTRQLASYLATPIFLVDPQGTLIFYNEPAERILGQKFEETGEMRFELWSTIFHPTDEAGNLLPPDALALTIAMTEHRPASERIWIRGLDDIPRRIDNVAFPIIGQSGRYLGAIAVFSEVGNEGYPLGNSRIASDPGS